MKYANPLSEVESITLYELMKHHPHYRTRTRAHAILLSASHYSINAIAALYHVHRNTVSCWLSQWEHQGIVGLFEEARSGRPSKLTEEEQLLAKALLEEHPRSPKYVVELVKQKTGKGVSVDTIKRLARYAQLVWKRVRKSLKAKRDPGAFVIAQQEIAALHEQEAQQTLDVYYFDEAGFSLEPVVPYAWQPKGQTIQVPAARSARLHVLGFLTKHQAIETFIVEGQVDTQVVIACFEAFSKIVNKPACVILDNAAQHTSKAFKQQRRRWEADGLYIKYLPPYSPELNLIEILWRFSKYRWLPFSAYLNFSNLRLALEDILKHLGTKYQITFA